MVCHDFPAHALSPRLGARWVVFFEVRRSGGIQLDRMSQRPFGDGFFIGWGQQSQRDDAPGPPAKKQRNAAAPAAAVPAGAAQQPRAVAKKKPSAAPARVDAGAFVAACSLEEYAEAWLKLTMGKGTRCQLLNQMQANVLKPAELRAVRHLHAGPQKRHASERAGRISSFFFIT